MNFVKISKIDDNSLKKARDYILSDELVAFPTETVYGLGANAYDVQAVKNIYKAKGRPSDNPLIVHLADSKEIPKVAREIPENMVSVPLSTVNFFDQCVLRYIFFPKTAGIVFPSFC